MSINILYLHHNILSRIKNDEKIKNETIILMNEIIQKNDVSNDVMNEIYMFKNNIEQDSLNDIFIAQTLLLVEEYTTILKKPVSHEEKKSHVIIKRKQEIIRLYISLCNIFIKNKNWNDFSIPSCASFLNEKKHCLNCENFDENSFEIDDFNRRICMNCFSQISEIETGLTPRDYNRVNTMSKFNYNRVLHFQDCMRQYQGKQNCNIPRKIYQDLEEKFKAYRILIDNSNINIRYSKVTRNHISVFLKELKYIKHYENINLIYFNLTNKRFDDITYLEDQLMEDFKKLISLYDSIHGKDGPRELERKNFMNVQYLLFQLLKRHGHNCKIEDFTIIKTIDRKLFHDNICRNLFNLLNWKFTPIF